MTKHTTRNEARRARLAGIVKAVALVLLAVLLLVTLSLTDAEEPPKEADRYAQFAAQARYYDVVERYGDLDGAVEAALVVYEKEGQ